jgi:homoaconitase/3-isopropylmalate dehydratase large subunit
MTLEAGARGALIAPDQTATDYFMGHCPIARIWRRTSSGRKAHYRNGKGTNAYTEALNRVAKGINRAGRGYSFDVLRAHCPLW